jgi:hypothetical protein
MTSPVPAAVVSDGNLKVFFTPTIADPSNPTVAECTSVSGFDVSCYFTDDGWAATVNENVVTDGRLCSREVFEGVGTSTNQLAIKYVYRQQDMASATNKAYIQFRKFSTGFFVTRAGTAFEPDIAAGDVVNVYPAVFDTQVPVTGASNEMQKIAQNVRISNNVQRDVVVIS